MNEKTTKIIAEIFGMMMGDGWISLSKKGSLTCGFSGEKIDLISIKSDLIEIFGDIGKATINTRETTSMKYGISGTTTQFCGNVKLAKEFIKLGMPTGKRVEQNFSIPDWILLGSKEVKLAFISGIYAAEGDTPKFQKNNKTIKAISFTLSKREYIVDKYGDVLINQISQILSDIGIEHSIKRVRVKTCDWNIKSIFVLSNSNDNMILISSMFNLRYNLEKRTIFKYINLYLTYKEKVFMELKDAYDYVFNSNESATKISEKLDISKYQIENWRRRKTGYKIPGNFPTFDNFVKSCGPL